MGIILHRVFSRNEVISGPRPLVLASLQALFQSVEGDSVSHFRGIRGLSGSSSSAVSFGVCTLSRSLIKKLYTVFRLQSSILVLESLSRLIVWKKLPAKFGERFFEIFTQDEVLIEIVVVRISCKIGVYCSL